LEDVIVIVCGWTRAGRSHTDGRLDADVVGLAGAGWVAVALVVAVLVAPAACLVVLVVLALLLVTIVDPHAHRVMTATTIAAIDVPKRGLDTICSATRGPRT
jgi:hypothetical protein